MDGDSLRMLIVAVVASVFSLWVMVSFFVRIGGVWIQEPPEGQRNTRVDDEVELAQLGPWVTGRRIVAGGVQEFSGFLIGRTVRLKRRDRGVDFLMDSGFPEAIARQVDGDISAKLVLTLVDGGTRLSGTFVPNKVEFTHQPPRITSTYALAAVPRSFRRVEGAQVSEPDALPPVEAVD